MSFGVVWSPLLPTWALIAAAVAVVLVAVLLIVSRTRGTWWRVGAMALALAAIANPVFTQEDRDPLRTVVAVVIDRSASQSLADRARITDEAKAALERNFARSPGFEVRWVDAGASDGQTDGTHLFEALRQALSDVPAERVGGAIMVTDGQVHDVPAQMAALGFQAPVHALITGRSTDRDRRVVLIQTPRFGIVGQSQTVGFRVEDNGTGGRAAQVAVTIRRDGEVIERRTVQTATSANVSVQIAHAGANIVEIEVDPLEGELTAVNNRAVVIIEGIREKLRVLLVSGEPHAGERTWRNLLKSDAGVDLVHFTILRPPEKQDGTPINELSLIAFPTRELFQIKIREFDLIIFDRYAQQGILPLIYFDNIARYVRNGGALLVAAGPEHATASSINDTPLEAILPAAPTGEIMERPFHARVSDLGRRHPVTRALPGMTAEGNPQWSRWFRLVESRRPAEGSTTVMDGPDNRPLLLLGRQGEGRVALLLSDHIWLWARGFEGGGPHLELLRRLSHWLMKEPELEEESLKLAVRGRQLVVELQTMAETPEPVTLTRPSGASDVVTMQPAEPGLWRGQVDVTELGLWRAQSGRLTRLVNVGPPNPREFTDVTSTLTVLEPLVRATGGGLWRISEDGNLTVPRIVPTRSTTALRGEDWMGLRQRDASVVRGIGILPAFAGVLGLILLLGALTAVWAREGR
ncbi:hypothetical protein E8L99_22475 [Phreatobacter aquaticus]|uniref:Glutamine amidotransferase domain-containing protein n=1 Tax=Phreatobacter aquaticus TaxID=2570229 RepID=A0A4D7QTA2_9HYPH|nr:hypothetical protein [Phreatobacter aquaticus]QCK88327.1 hypothetical protein E8L99_22475 [Phreatobacter aquaticus]